jgi:hypothetical protein
VSGSGDNTVPNKITEVVGHEQLGIELSRRRTSKSKPERGSATATSLQGRLRANNRRGGGKATRNMKPEQDGVRTLNGNFIITVGRRESSSTGGRPKGGCDKQTRSGKLVISDVSRSTRHKRHPETTPENEGPRKQPNHNGGTQVGGGDRRRWNIHTDQGSSGVCCARGGKHLRRRLGGNRGSESRAHTSIQAVADSPSSQGRDCFAGGNHGGGSLNPRGSARRHRNSALRGAEGVQEGAGAEGWMLKPATRMPRQQ